MIAEGESFIHLDLNGNELARWGLNAEMRALAFREGVVTAVDKWGFVHTAKVANGSNATWEKSRIDWGTINGSTPITINSAFLEWIGDGFFDGGEWIAGGGWQCRGGRARQQ
ncbi:MAG: hypothetical protein LR015_00480 [Verrucomicrobia bacterium]|nr:hypothetical protein [Verrucomicrobiota bacterium]